MYSSFVFYFKVCNALILNSVPLQLANEESPSKFCVTTLVLYDILFSILELRKTRPRLDDFDPDTPISPTPGIVYRE